MSEASQVDTTVKSYPVALVHLDGAPVLVAGAGPIAARKVAELLEVSAAVTVVAKHISPSMAPHLPSLAAVERRAAVPADVIGATLVIAATDDREVNRALAEAATARGILVNAVDDPEVCTFYAPAVVRRGTVTISVSTDGRSPLLAGRLRRFIEAVVPASLGELAGVAAAARARGLAGLGSTGRLLTALADPKAARLVDRGDRAAAAERLVAVAAGPAAALDPGTVAIVGAGPGGRAELTLRALETLHAADVVIHDALVSEAVLDEILPGTRRVAAGRRCGAHRMTQSATIRLMIREAQAQQRVVRLHGGDPGVFGRAGEEIDALDAAGVGWTLVPGVSASLAAASLAGIPMTRRGESRGVTIRTGHGKDGYVRTLDVPRAEETLVVLMGHGAVGEIMEGLIDEGRDPQTPAAAISRAGLPDQRVLLATIGTLAEAVESAALVRPVTFVIGEVAKRARVASAVAARVAA